MNFDILDESVAQKEKFRIAANKLLNQCFLVKSKEETKKEYMFVLQNKAMFNQYFELLGYQLKINDTMNVISLENQFGFARLRLSKFDSIMLLIFRLLYIEKRKEISTYDDTVTVLMEEIREKYSMLKIKNQLNLNKSMERGIISLFKRYNLVQNIETDVTEADARIIIYPSIVMAVQFSDLDDYYEKVKNLLQDYEQGDDSAEEELDAASLS